VKKIVVTGLGSFNALGHTFAQTWANLKNNHCALERLPEVDRTYLGMSYAGRMKDYDDKADLSEYWLDRSLKLSRHALNDALHSAALNTNRGLINSKVSIIAGSATSGFTTIDETYNNFRRKDKTRVSAYFNISSQGYTLGAYTARLLKLSHATGLNINNSCATGLHAIEIACERIQQGLCDVAIVTVADSPFNSMITRSFQTMRALSNNDQVDAAEVVRPFDQHRSGFALSEGAAVLILESEHHAAKRDAPCYGHVLAVASRLDSYHWTSPHPQGTTILNCMTAVMNRLPDTLTKQHHVYINAHGTATQLGDHSELTALTRLAKQSTNQFYVSSTKGHTGHMLSTTGLLETMFTLASLRDQTFVKTRNLTALDHSIDYPINLTFEQTPVHPMTIGLSNSIGFGGFNSCVALSV